MAEIVNGVVKTGNVAIAVTGTAVPLSTTRTTLVNGVVVSAPLTNTAPIYVGESAVTNTAGAAGNGFYLDPGQQTVVPAFDVALVYINGTSGDVASWIAS